MEYYCFTLTSDADIDVVWDHLHATDFRLLYSSEEPSQNNSQSTTKSIYGYLADGLLPSEVISRYPDIAALHPVQFDQINWHDQWGTTPESPAIFIDLEKHSNVSVDGFSMIPGPGFGDLSHPTTRLILQMMAPLVQGKWVIDLGSGSGILSLAAIKLGAIGACGIEIDPEAIAHAQFNASLNQLENLCHFQLPTQSLSIPKGAEVVLVMNMIHSEQKEAWNSLPLLHTMPMICLTSGILQSEEPLYHSICHSRCWEFVDSIYEKPWCGFHHRRN